MRDRLEGRGETGAGPGYLVAGDYREAGEAVAAADLEGAVRAVARRRAPGEGERIRLLGRAPGEDRWTAFWGVGRGRGLVLGPAQPGPPVARPGGAR